MIAFVGCSQPPESEVAIHWTVDKDTAAPILSAFHRKMGGTIQPSVAGELSVDADPPTVDVVWHDDVLQTIRLQRLGMLRRHSWPVEAGYPSDMKARDNTWCGFAARGRVLLVNTEKIASPDAFPQSVDDLADPAWSQNCAIAFPLIGTTATHAAMIRQLKGEAEALTWFKRVADNAIVYPTNQAVAIAVATGKVAWGLTDSDDAIAERDEGRPVAIVFPDQATQAAGTLRIPNTVAILANAPHPIAARKLVDYLVTPQTEDRLAMGNSSQLPLSRSAAERPRVLPNAPVRWMRADFEAAAEHWEAFAEKLTPWFPNSKNPRQN